MDEHTDIFKDDEYTDPVATKEARQSELLPKGWYTPSGVTVRQVVEVEGKKNPGRRDVDIDLSFEQENGSLAFVTYYTSPDKDNGGAIDYRFRQWASIEKLYKTANTLPAEEKVLIRDIITFLSEGGFQAQVTVSKDDTNMVQKLRLPK